MQVSTADRIKDLRAHIMRLEGFRPASGSWPGTGTSSFPWQSFPVGAVHELLCSEMTDLSPTAGFIAGLLSHLNGNKDVILWISASRNLFPSALAPFGLRPDCVIFLDAVRERDVAWAMEEALKCPALSAVVGEIRDLDFTASRRLQLAVEKSCVTGFVIRKNPRTITTTACVSRWRITSLPSAADDQLPGLGFPVWKVELLKMRNGQPGCWIVRWMNEQFIEERSHVAAALGERKAV